MRQQQRGRRFLVEEIAGNPAEQEFAQPAVTEGPHHHQVGTQRLDLGGQSLLDRVAFGQFMEFGMKAVPRQVTHGVGCRKQAIVAAIDGQDVDLRGAGKKLGGTAQRDCRFVAAVPGDARAFDRK